MMSGTHLVNIPKFLANIFFLFLGMLKIVTDSIQYRKYLTSHLFYQQLIQHWLWPVTF